MFGGRGYRWMFWLTGMPGWMRTGILPPCATLLTTLNKEQQIEILKKEQAEVKKYLQELEEKIKELSERK
jgi:hypothetical protein